MTKDKALKIALGALEDAWYEDYGNKKIKKAITAIEEALSQPKQEPVAWMDDYNACKCSDNETRCFSDRVFRMMQKYTAPPQREWVGLTDEELTEIRLKTFDSVATNIEAKLKENK